ncbi:MAG: HAD family hydrolase [Candidatus Bathyarchaeia archaeon]
MRVEAVLFDLFNTLVLLENDDAFYMPSLKRLHNFLVNNEIDISFEDFVRVYFEVRDRLYEETSESLEDPHFNIRVSRTLEKFGHRLGVSHPTVVGATGAFCEEFMKYARPDDDVLYVLERLHKKYKLGIVSNFSIPECASRLLEKFGMNGFFDAVVISGAINKRKPSPEIYERALSTLDIEADRAVFVGDTPGIDIRGAKTVGLKAVLIERQQSPRDSLSLSYELPEAHEKVLPDGVIKGLRELLDLLENYGHEQTRAHRR